MKIRRVYIIAVLIGAVPFLEAQSGELTYPSRPLRMIVGFPAGGAPDVMARTIGKGLTNTSGQQVVVDNRPGAGGIIAAETAANAPADGYTLLFISSAHAVSAALHEKLSYHAVKSYEPITLVASTPQVLVVHPSMPVSSVTELITMAKSKPGKLNFGSAGYGSTTHLAAELFNGMAAVDITHVPYKGGPLALTDLIGGQIQLMFFTLPGALLHIKSGRVKAIGVTSTKRSPLLPQVPCIAESLPGYDVTNWFGVLAPAGTSKQLIRRLHALITKALRTLETADSLAKQGAAVESGSPEEFGLYLTTEVLKWRRVARKVGARLN